MGRIRSHKPRLSGRWIGSEVSTDIPCRQIQGTQARDLQVRKILAYPPSLAKDLFGSCANSGYSRIEPKVSVDAVCEIQKALAQRPSASKRLERILCKVCT